MVEPSDSNQFNIGSACALHFSLRQLHPRDQSFVLPRSVRLGCGHMTTCIECTSRLNPLQCPQCREPIRMVLKQRPTASSLLRQPTFAKPTWAEHADSMFEAARKAAEAEGLPITPTSYKAGLESLEGFDANGLMAPITVTAEDHGGGGKTRIEMWDGETWVPQTDWISEYTDVVWDVVKESSSKYEQ